MRCERQPSMLERGISVPDRQEHLMLQNTIDILLVSEHNHGCMDLALELQQFQEESLSCILSWINIVSTIGGIEKNEFNDRREDSNADSEANMKYPVLSTNPKYLLLYLNKDTFAGLSIEQER